MIWDKKVISVSCAVMFFLYNVAHGPPRYGTARTWRLSLTKACPRRMVCPSSFYGKQLCFSRFLWQQYLHSGQPALSPVGIGRIHDCFADYCCEISNVSITYGNRKRSYNATDWRPLPINLPWPFKSAISRIISK